MFQSPRRWGGVGLTAGVGKRADVREFQSPRRWGGVGLVDNFSVGSDGKVRVSIPSEAGAGSGSHRTSTYSETWNVVSIPSEVGRGRAPLREVVAPRAPPAISFNPLGGGAGSGSECDAFLVHVHRVMFQSPRRWGGVGLLIGPVILRDVANPGFNPLGGGAGSGSRKADVSQVRTLTSVSIPSEVGRGRAPELVDNMDDSLHPVSIPSEVGRGRAPCRALISST